MRVQKALSRPPIPSPETVSAKIVAERSRGLPCSVRSRGPTLKGCRNATFVLSRASRNSWNLISGKSPWASTQASKWNWPFRQPDAPGSQAEPLGGEWMYQMKNRLERRLRKLVCSGALDVKIAQQEIARDWIGAYKKYLSGPGQVQSNR